MEPKMINREVLSVTQGSDEWLAIRANHFTASEAPIALGQSKYTSRTELLRQKATGISEEVGTYKQALFDEGHATEAIARTFAEEIIGSDLYPTTVKASIEGLDMLASLDGQTMDEVIIWEHKLRNDELVAAIKSGNLDPHYTIQMDQQLLVSGAEKCLFMASNGTRESMVWCWYESSQEKFDGLIAGWKRFASDLAEYVPVDIPAKAVATPQESLPAPFAQVSGNIAIRSNLDLFGVALRAFIDRIPEKPETDQDFADTDDACKRLKDAEDSLGAAEDTALASVSDVEQLRRTVASLRELARQTRLAKEKLVEARKKQIKETAVSERRQKYGEHVAGLNAELGEVNIVVPMPDFVGAIKGLKTIASLYDKLDTALANGKIVADAAAKDLRAKLDWHKPHAEYAFLFRDLQALIQKPKEDFELAVTTRIEAHKQAEEKRKTDEAEKAKAVAHAVQPAPVAEPAKQVTAPWVAPAVSTPKGAPTLRLGVINERLAPIALTAEGLATLGFKHSATDKAAKLYFESEFEPICAALVRHLEAALQKQAA
jgi:putative phage-type endonuclease